MDKKGRNEAVAMTFVRAFCQTNNLPYVVGDSSVEQTCAKIAGRAREDYKKIQSARTPNCRKSHALSTKHAIRLHNNRKSAQASKVYNEVFKRSLSHYLAVLERKIGDPLKERTSTEAILKKLTDMQSKYSEVKRDRDVLDGQLQEARLHIEDLKEERRRQNELRVTGVALSAPSSAPSTVPNSSLEDGLPKFHQNPETWKAVATASSTKAANAHVMIDHQMDFVRSRTEFLPKPSESTIRHAPAPANGPVPKERAHVFDHHHPVYSPNFFECPSASPQESQDFSRLLVGSPNVSRELVIIP